MGLYSNSIADQYFDNDPDILWIYVMTFLSMNNIAWSYVF